jgi:SAM-dependent methyltransferase
MTEAAHTPALRPPLQHPPSLEELTARYAGADIVIVGNGPTGRRDYTSLGLPLWVVNGGWMFHPGAELCWMMDDLEGPAWEDVPGLTAEMVRSGIITIHGEPVRIKEPEQLERPREYWEAITARCPVPIMTDVAYPEKFPQTIAYPKDEVQQRLGRTYFAETVCWAAAWALHIGVRSVAFGGCDYNGARPAERAGLEYMIGRLEEAGIPVKVFPGSSLLSTGPVDGKNRHVAQAYGTRDWTPPPDHSHPLDGAMDDESWLHEGDERLGYLALEALLAEPNIKTVLDVGCGPGEHARHLSSAGKRVIGVDPAAVEIGSSEKNGGSMMLLQADYLDPETLFAEPFDAIWCCHMLEHVDDPQAVLCKMHQDLRDGGLLALTVPPATHAMVGGHFTLWNAGLLLYHLVRAGFDCRDARIRKYGYNLSVLVRKTPVPEGSVPKQANHAMAPLRPYLPEGLAWRHDSFDGDIHQLNWE